ncbi:hypothetical protein DPEC_G00351340 [Dallia pectoralis]|uniref:Uncharacterized protein n=1 Tax=Dallia pectoralis TaxID=75939 RepID=A0ACC2F209_DALPE|nr:hypothetical protein DPEC_G00351340 [Dallia pectoralis]
MPAACEARRTGWQTQFPTVNCVILLIGSSSCSFGLVDFTLSEWDNSPGFSVMPYPSVPHPPHHSPRHKYTASP